MGTLRIPREPVLTGSYRIVCWRCGQMKVLNGEIGTVFHVTTRTPRLFASCTHKKDTLRFDLNQLARRALRQVVRPYSFQAFDVQRKAVPDINPTPSAVSL